jgi:hypothetical protein
MKENARMLKQLRSLNLPERERREENAKYVEVDLEELDSQ